MNTTQVQRFAAKLKVGQVCNIRMHRHDAAMPRLVTFVGNESRKNGQWIVWRWKPEATTPEGRMDCGYSGYRIHDAQQVAA